MKTDIHPDYVDCTVTCSCGNTFTTRATVAEMRVELCSECHPFFTGKQKLVDTGGRVERFNKRYSTVDSPLERKAKKQAERKARAEAEAAEAAERKARREAEVVAVASEPEPEPDAPAAEAADVTAASGAEASEPE
ncbi:MAG: 50S ribosomal protein L31 [Acidimicrobiia bacterium]